MGTFGGVELDDLVLTSSRLTLRPWERGDADRVVEVMRDESMFTFLPLPRPYTMDAAVDFVMKFGEEGRTEGSGVGCAVVETATGRVVGSAALRLPRRNLAGGEIGYWVAGDARGNGYAAEASRTLLEWGHAHGVSRIEIRCHVANLASARAAMRAGARFEAVLNGAMAVVDGVPERALPGDEAIFASFADEPKESIPDAYPPLPALTDGVVALRVQQPGDAAGVIEQERDPVTRSWEFTADESPDARYARSCARAAMDWIVGKALNMAIVDVASGRFAGTLQVMTFGPPKVGLVGYVVHPHFRGRGYAARALRLLTPWAFEQAGFARLELGAKVDNVASRRAAAAGGFEPDGIAARRLANPDGTFSDEARFALINPRFR